MTWLTVSGEIERFLEMIMMSQGRSLGGPWFNELKE